ncbi:SMI1/KNR4 family protein, partial [Pseudomonas edaphica]
LLVSDYEVLTGYPLAHRWQKKKGQLAAGKRLLPKIPCVLGGGFVLNNLYSIDAVKGMKLRADIARQIKDLPDGAQIKLRLDS